MEETIEVPFAMWTHVGLRNLVLSGGPDPPGKGAIWGISRSIVRIRNIRSEPNYSLAGSSDSAVRCQYCSTLFIYSLLLITDRIRGKDTAIGRVRPSVRLFHSRF